MKAIVLFLGSLLVFQLQGLNAQNTLLHPSNVVQGVYGGLSKPLTEYPQISSADIKKTGDPLSLLEVLGSFDGQFLAPSEYWPPCANGDVNSAFYVQTVYKSITVYTRNGQKVWGPVPIIQIFGNLPGTDPSNQQGPATLYYDDQAGRWFLAEMTTKAMYPLTNWYMIAISSSSDPSGTWHTYSFQVGDNHGEPTFGIWRDAYYAESIGLLNSNAGVFAFERTPMLDGDPARLIAFTIPAADWGFWGMDPVDNDGDFAPEGSPGLFIALNDTADGGAKQQIWLYGLHADWANPSNSTFGVIDKIDVEKTNNALDSVTWEVPQKGSSQKLGVIPGMFMHAPQYRNFGTYQTIVGCNNVNMNSGQASFHAGIEWYEFRKTGKNTSSIIAYRHQMR